MKIESTHSIEITDFVDQAQINPKFFYRPYFLEPQKGGDKTYSLLYKALLETGKVGIAKVVIQRREYLAAVKPDGLFLMLELMHFAHEVLEPEMLKSASEKDVSPKELDMAKTLIEQMAADWEPEKYKDQYTTALMEMIEQKASKKLPAGKPVAPQNGAERGGLRRRPSRKPAESRRPERRTEKTSSARSLDQRTRKAENEGPRLPDSSRNPRGSAIGAKTRRILRADGAKDSEHMKGNPIEVQLRDLPSHAKQMAANLHFPFQGLRSDGILPACQAC